MSTISRLVAHPKQLSNQLSWVRKRWLRTYPDDVWIVSYPKSGNTWLRFLVGNLVDPMIPVTFENLEVRVQDIYKHDNAELARYPRPRLLKSHEPYNRRYPTVLYVIRDPRAVLVSFHHHLRRIGMIADAPITATADRFLRGGRWGRWSDHVTGWLDTPGRGQRVLSIRYEQLFQAPEAEAQRICAFLGIDRSGATIAACVELSSARRMRDLERRQSELWIETASRRKDIPFIRRASADAWRRELPPEVSERVFAEFSETMSRLGYPR